MDVLLLSRIQFALTIAFHYLYPPLSIGLGVMLVIMEGLWLKTGNDRLSPDGAVLDQGLRAHLRHRRGHRHRDGVRVRHQLGDLLPLRGRRVRQRPGGGGHLRLLPRIGLPGGAALFGWDRVSRGMHFFATCMVCLGAHFSAIWIVVANSWMQTPAGFHIVGEGLNARAEITDFWQMVFNPSSMDRFFHTLCGAWQAGAFLVVSVSAWYLLKKQAHRISRAPRCASGWCVGLAASLLQLVSGHASAVGVARNQPAKLAAFEGLYQTTANAPLHLFGWVDEKNETVKAARRIPGLLSFLALQRHRASR